MAFPETPSDVVHVPIPVVYVPGVGWAALQGSTNTNTDGSANLSAPANFNLAQIGSVVPEMADSDGSTPAQTLLIAQGLYNGTSIDRVRGNLDNISLHNVSGGTSSQTGTDQTNLNHRGVKVVINTTIIGTASLAVVVQGKDPVSGTYFTLLTSASITTNTTLAYTVYPGITAVAQTSVSDILPRTWRVNVTHNNANAATYTIAAIYIV